jgi:hypothetical protein
MASGWFTKGLYKVSKGQILIEADTLKLMLVKAAYVFDKDDEFISDLGAVEIVATNYVGGFGGAGRKTAVVTGQANVTADRAEWAIADLTWLTIGGAANDTIGGAVLVKEIVNDAGSPVIVFFDIADINTNGGNITFDFLDLAAGGNIRINN